MRRLAFLTCLLLSLLLPAAASGEAPLGPRLATVEMIEAPGPRFSSEEKLPDIALATIDPSTGKQRRFLRANMGAAKRIVPSPFHAPAWSPDGSLIAFAGHQGDEESTPDRIYVAGSDGAGAHPVPGTRGGSQPVLSPDGFTLAFSRTRFRSNVRPGRLYARFYSSTTTWIVDLRGGKPRRLTRWRNGFYNSPGAFTADGAALLVTKEDTNLEGQRIVQLSLADGSAREIVKFGTEPAVSPDGTRIAFVGYLDPDLVEAEENHDYLAGDLYVAASDGSGVRRLSRSEDVLESAPSWDPSGQRIAYVQFRADTSFVPGLALLFPTGNALMQVNADGSCREKILTQPRVAFYGAAWQPGPGREAAPISC